jgi:hypothetical protein
MKPFDWPKNFASWPGRTQLRWITKFANRIDCGQSVDYLKAQAKGHFQDNPITGVVQPGV